ncbi:MAG: molybdopterin molybdotransferase MoeA [Planctomycetota bacterium]|jgi:molybdopterin molybdotransferase
MSKDVRMRGFERRTDVAEAVKLIDERVRPLTSETVELMSAGGRVLARDLASPVDVPAFKRAAMDGYAVIAEETFGATTHDPRPFTVVGESLPARPAAVSVEAGTCVRIMTGAPVPDGADAVVPVEYTEREGDAVRAREPITPGKHVGEPGEDIKKGTLLFRAGRKLKPQDLGVLSSIGVGRLLAIKQPRVGLIVTGNELLPPGSQPNGYSIVDANTPMLKALVERDGGTLLTGPILKDDRDLLKEALEVCAKQTDVVLISGGSSVGVEDHAPVLLNELGELPVHGMALRPASPAGIGFLEETPVFLLPGNPVSCLCAYDFFAGRAVRIRAGLHPNWPHIRVRMPLARKISSVLGRTDYARVRIEQGKVVPLAIRGASILSSTTRAHGFVLIPRDAEGFAEGEAVEVLLY